ncbi:MAG: terminase TerL endonuclease subunit [Parvularcula sp.]|jgi:phage terminase large subunit-like protein|nr:terminase TerL endonuclease subunit [Parvularcula sp.]
MTISGSDPTTKYANDVLTGKIIAGEFARLAAKRHLTDLAEGSVRGLVWDVDAASRAIGFFPAVLSITEGAKEGAPFHLLPWHVFVVGSVYGWRDAAGHRRFRSVWLETGKGQAKSPLMAGLGLYEITGRQRRRAEVYCIGEDRKTANVMFRDAVAMCRAPIPDKDGETLENSGRVIIRGFGDNAWKVEHPSSGSKMEPVANTDAISGPKPTLVLADEIHEMKTNKALSIWRSAIAKMSGDPMMVLGTNTPSIDQAVGTELSEFYQKVLRGEFTDDGAFAFIARTDKDDDPFNDESCWVKSLPALGITYPVANVRKEVETSKWMISTALTTKRLYFGIPVGTAGFWISEDAWESTQGEVDEDAMRGRRCHLSLDLSQKNDLTALSACWEGDTLAVKTWYWTRDFEVAARSTADKINYREIAEAGQLTITAGRTIDYSFVAEQVRVLCARHEVEQLVVDAAHLEDFMKACRENGFDVWMFEGEDEPTGVGLRIVRHAQGKRVVFEGQMLCMPISIRHLEDHILKGTLIIERNRLTTICASNAVLDTDAQKNKAFDKNRSRGRIDGMVTIAMAVGSATSAMEGREFDVAAMFA